MKRVVVPMLMVSTLATALAVWRLLVAPPDTATFYVFQQPLALLTLAAIAVCGVSSALFLHASASCWDDVARAAAECAAFYGVAVLVGGACWRKASSGAWWDGDELLSIILLAWLNTTSYLLVRRFAAAGADRLAAGLGIFAALSLPFIFVLVGRGASVRPTQIWCSAPALSVAVAIGAWTIALVVVRVDQLGAERELIALRERAVDRQVVRD